MKNLKYLFTALLLLCATVATAHDFVKGGIYYNITSTTDFTVEVTYRGSSYYQYSNEYSGNVVIPESVTYNGSTYSVTSIDSYAFYNCSGLTSVVIPNSVTSIGEWAFFGCSGLTSIEILDGVTGIGEEAFRGCCDLEYIYISSTIESIGDYAFAECNNIFDIKIGSKKAVAASENVFSSDAYNNACLYVPAGRKDFYAKTSPWSNFIIQETDFTGIDEVKGENGKVEGVYYDLNGRAVERPANGLYIKNGKKVFVK